MTFMIILDKLIIPRKYLKCVFIWQDGVITQNSLEQDEYLTQNSFLVIVHFF